MRRPITPQPDGFDLAAQDLDRAVDRLVFEHRIPPAGALMAVALIAMSKMIQIPGGHARPLLQSLLDGIADPGEPSRETPEASAEIDRRRDAFEADLEAWIDQNLPVYASHVLRKGGYPDA